MTFDRAWKKICVAMCVVASPCTFSADVSLPYDHYNPVVLNQYAVERIRQGDLSSAGILLERAHLLAPYETRIERNLRTLRLLQTGVQKPYRLLILPANETNGTNVASVQSPEAVSSEADMLPPYTLWEIK